MAWDFDMSAAPDDKPVILAGKKLLVTKSRWLPPGKDRPVGRWEGFAVGEVPKAWMLWPEHPEAGADMDPIHD